jgi:hypothetical protein
MFSLFFLFISFEEREQRDFFVANQFFHRVGFGSGFVFALAVHLEFSLRTKCVAELCSFTLDFNIKTPIDIVSFVCWLARVVVSGPPHSASGWAQPPLVGRRSRAFSRRRRCLQPRSLHRRVAQPD